MVQVKLEQFEGPLDLLLQLTSEQKLDITAVSLAKVTEQFLEYVKNLPEKNPVILADFLVTAAKLLLIKSKALLPNLDLGIEEEEVVTDLTAQLLLYKKYREVAKYLKRLDAKRHQSWIHESDFSDRVTFLPDPEATLPKLIAILRRVALELKEIAELPKQILAEVISITEKIEHIQKLITEKLETSLSNLIQGSKSKMDLIVTFLALLELVKQKALVVEQSEIFDEIMIRKAN